MKGSKSKFTKSMVGVIIALFIFLNLPLLNLPQVSGSFDYTTDGETSDEQITPTRSSTGTTYYVDSKLGNDTNNGTSINTPWKSTEPVNQGKDNYNPGDRILFRRGCIWYDFILMRSTGTKNNKIYYGAYGNGPNPIFDLNNASKPGFSVSGSNTTIENFTLRNIGNQGIICENSRSSVYNITIRNIDLFNIGQNGILYSRGGGNVLIENVTIRNASNCGIAIMGSIIRKIHNVLIKDCLVSNTKYNDGISIHEGDSTSRTSAGSNITLINNHCEFNNEQGYDITSGSDILMINNTSFKNGVGSLLLAHSAHDIEIVGHRSSMEPTATRTGGTIVCTVSNVTIHNSIFDGGNYHMMVFYPVEKDEINNIKLHNNIFNYKNGDLLQSKFVTNYIFKNNIFYSRNGSLGMMKFTDKINQITNHTFDNNVYSGSTGIRFWHASDGFINFTQFQKVYGMEKNGFEADPGFICPSNEDYYPSWNSILIDNGEGYNFDKDFAGNPIYGKRDIGPYEYQPPYDLDEDTISKEGKVRVYSDGKFRYILKDDPTASLQMETDVPWKKTSSFNPESIDIDIVQWNISGDYYKEWKEQHYIDVGCIDYTVGDHTVDSFSSISDNLTFTTGKNSNSTGHLSFSYNCSSRSRTLMVTVGDQPIISQVNADKTPTTGDGYTINVTATDDKGLSDGWIEYWFGTGIHQNVSMSKTSISKNIAQYTKEIEIGPNSTGFLNYILRVSDSDGKWSRSREYNANIMDNDPPYFSEDLSSDSVVRDNMFTFKIQAYDNIDISRMSVEYWFDEMNHTIKDLENPIHLEIVTPSSFESVSYFFNASDSSDNWLQTEKVTIIAGDIDPPELLEDLTPTSAIPGQTITFSFTAFDSSGIDDAYVEYWYGSAIHYNQSMGADLSHKHEIPTTAIDDLNYIFHFADNAGNWNETVEKSISIADISPPTFGEDESHISAKTGDDFVFSISISENFALSKVWLEYSYEDIAENISLIQSSGKVTHKIKIPLDAKGSIKYIFGAMDTSNNIRKTTMRSLPIIDNDEPTVEDHSPDSGTTGDPYTFYLNILDNIELQSVYLEYNIGNDPAKSVKMTSISDTYIHEMIMPTKANKNLFYTISAYDSSGNLFKTASREVVIIDNDPPTLKVPKERGITKTRGSTQFEVNVTDNTGEDHVYIEYWYPNGERIIIEMDKTNENYTVLLDIDIDSVLWRFIAYDFEGNQGKSDIYLFNTDGNSTEPDEETVIHVHDVEIIPNADQILSGEELSLGVIIWDQFGNVLPNDLFIIEWDVLFGPGEINEVGVFFSSTPGSSIIRVKVTYNEFIIESTKDIITNSTQVESEKSEKSNSSIMIPVVMASVILIIIVGFLVLIMNKRYGNRPILVLEEIDQIEQTIHEFEEVTECHSKQIVEVQEPELSDEPGYCEEIEDIDPSDDLIDEEETPSMQELDEMIYDLEQDPGIENILLMIDELSSEVDVNGKM